MKRSDENRNMKCDEIEFLLVRENFDELTGQENLLVEEHLKSCDSCRSYQKTLSNLQDSMRIGAERLTPDPAIRERVIERMEALKPRQAGIVVRSWHYARDLLQHRIPVYQPILGAVLVLLIFFGTRQLSMTTAEKAPDIQTPVRTEMVMPAQMSVMDNLEIVKAQKIGRSAGEDTTLARFIVSGI
jgi:predicted anti-sigma-YlaC factor YlaD